MRHYQIVYQIQTPGVTRCSAKALEWSGAPDVVEIFFAFDFRDEPPSPRQHFAEHVASLRLDWLERRGLDWYIDVGRITTAFPRLLEMEEFVKAREYSPGAALCWVEGVFGHTRICHAICMLIHTDRLMPVRDPAEIWRLQQEW